MLGKSIPHNFTQISGYVMQDSAFVKTLTVRETLCYVMRLRLLPTQYAGKEEEIITNILEILNLVKVKDSLIGDPEQRGISGGELRRLSIGVEMVLDMVIAANYRKVVSPSIIFMDEPTSGLDAINALRVVSTMRQLCRKGWYIFWNL